MAGVALTLASSNTAGGTGSDTVKDGGQYSDAAAAVAAVSGGFLVINAPVTVDGTTLKKTAYSVSQIRSIVSL